MSKAIKNSAHEKETEAFEIIELAIDDIDVLTRAFDVIKNVCDEVNDPRIAFESDLEKTIN